MNATLASINVTAEQIRAAVAANPRPLAPVVATTTRSNRYNAPYPPSDVELAKRQLAAGFTLRYVSRQSGMSTGYLSKLRSHWKDLKR